MDYNPHHSLPACHSHLLRCHGNLIKPLCRWLFNRWPQLYPLGGKRWPNARLSLKKKATRNVKHLGAWQQVGVWSTYVTFSLSLINNNGPPGWAGDKEPHPQLAHFSGAWDSYALEKVFTLNFGSMKICILQEKTFLRNIFLEEDNYIHLFS